ncbi:hypothetical protein LshimejAT787_1901000 [Lyophyllum shimeji]|uniref:Uncharacterized protein n=1 Tax=Lyophyllum shimeji TaxID=47721 RepID=A0A9P3PXU5_LYOSH|nr:hypothetical protein LshimejAT787_1901000 [Lyophyllum shimeji]
MLWAEQSEADDNTEQLRASWINFGDAEWNEHRPCRATKIGVKPHQEYSATSRIARPLPQRCAIRRESPPDGWTQTWTPTIGAMYCPARSNGASHRKKEIPVHTANRATLSTAEIYGILCPQIDGEETVQAGVTREAPTFPFPRNTRPGLEELNGYTAIRRSLAACITDFREARERTYSRGSQPIALDNFMAIVSLRFPTYGATNISVPATELSVTFDFPFRLRHGKEAATAMLSTPASRPSDRVPSNPGIGRISVSQSPPDWGQDYQKLTFPVEFRRGDRAVGITCALLEERKESSSAPCDAAEMSVAHGPYSTQSRIFEMAAWNATWSATTRPSVSHGELSKSKVTGRTEVGSGCL